MKFGQKGNLMANLFCTVGSEKQTSTCFLFEWFAIQMHGSRPVFKWWS